MVRSVEDAAILMAAISDIDLQGCNLNISSCLVDRVRFKKNTIDRA